MSTDKKILNLIDFLVRQETRLSLDTIAKHFTIEGKSITDRTLRRWFKKLRNPDFAEDFGYFRAINPRTLGLTHRIGIIYDAKPEIYEAIPYHAYFTKNVNMQNLSKCTLCIYWIPTDATEQFNTFWKTAKQMGAVSDYYFFSSFPIINFYAPFATTYSKFLALPADYDINFFLNKYTNTKNSEAAIHPLIKSNPYIIPILLEYSRENISSQKVWQEIESKLSDSWKQLKDIRKITTAYMGTKLVSTTIKALNETPQFFTQARVDYAPAYANHINAYVIVKTKEDISLLKELAPYCLMMFVARGCDNNTLFVELITNNKGLINALSDIIPKYSQENIVLLESLDESRQFFTRKYMKLDWSTLFDPLKLEWKFDVNEYIKKLNTKEQTTNPAQ